MKRILLSIAACVLAVGATAQEWAPVGENIKTRWAEDIDPS